MPNASGRIRRITYRHRMPFLAGLSYMDQDRTERLAWNEALFRKVNELTELERMRHQDDRSSIICECSRLTCQMPLRVSLKEYQAVRKHPARFIIFPGHEVLAIEAVVGGDPSRYIVVEKTGAARAAAVEEDS